MKKTQWREMITEIYHQEISPKMRRVRRRFHPADMDYSLYQQRQLFRASQTIRFIDGVDDDDPEISKIFQQEHISRTLQNIKNANEEFNKRALVDTGIVDVFEEYFTDIISELDVSDLPTQDIEALREAGSPNPQAELRLRIKTIKKRYIKETRQNDHASLSRSVEVAGKKVQERIDSIKEPDAKSSPKRRWFKGLGSLCRGTVLTGVDISLLSGAWLLPLSPDTTIVGSVASIATGLGDIAIGIGEFCNE